MRKEKRITVGEFTIIASELTVEEVTNIMDGLEGQPVENYDLLFPDRLPAVAVRQITDLPEAKMAKMTPSELDAIWTAAEEVNSFFAGMVGRLATLGAAALATGDLSATTSKQPAVS